MRARRHSGFFIGEDGINLALGPSFGANSPLLGLSSLAAFQLLSEEIDDKTKAFLRSMPYDLFLKSVYWKTVRRFVLWKRGGRCAQCGRTKHIQLHHETYEHRGSEYLHLDDLIVLCETCHKAYGHMNKDMLEVLLRLVERKRAPRSAGPVLWNPNYDPHALKHYAAEHGGFPE